MAWLIKNFFVLLCKETVSLCSETKQNIFLFSFIVWKRPAQTKTEHKTKGKSLFADFAGD